MMSKSHTSKATQKSSKNLSSVKWTEQTDPLSLTPKSNGFISQQRERGLIMDVLPHIRRYNRSGLASLVKNCHPHSNIEQDLENEKDKEVCSVCINISM